MPHITFVHGISNKPEREALRRLWLDGLSRDNGIDCNVLGITTSMVYWADVMYDAPLTGEAGLREAVGDPTLEDLGDATGTGAGDDAWRCALSPEEQRFVDSLAHQLDSGLPEDEKPGISEVEAGVGSAVAGAEADALVVLERVPLPWFIKRPLMKVLLRDVHHYLFNASHAPRAGESFMVRDEIRQRFIAAARAGAEQPGPHIVVSHSMGTVIAYDCLLNAADCPTVDALVTIGSPLGLDEIQDRLETWSRHDGFPPRVRGRWINVYDRLDPVVGFDPKFANDYRRGGIAAVEDVEEPNWGRWRHSITKYLAGTQLRSRLGELLDA